MLYLYKGNQIEIVEKKSRFIGTSFSVKDVSTAQKILEETRKKYWDATHNCYAYFIDENTQKCSDDGEPSKTAGFPILDVLLGNKIYNSLIIVTRYFGGTLLGTGGLVRAYGHCAKLALEASEVIDVIDGYLCDLHLNYEQYGKINYILQEEGTLISNTIFLEYIQIQMYITKNEKNILDKKISEVTNGQVFINVIKEVKFAKRENEILEL